MWCTEYNDCRDCPNKAACDDFTETRPNYGADLLNETE